MEENSVEVSEESRRDSKVSLDVVQPVSQAVDAYRVPVIFDKDNQRQETKTNDESGKFTIATERTHLGSLSYSGNALKVWSVPYL